MKLSVFCIWDKISLYERSGKIMFNRQILQNFMANLGYYQKMLITQYHPTIIDNKTQAIEPILYNLTLNLIISVQQPLDHIITVPQLHIRHKDPKIVSEHLIGMLCF